MGMMETNIAHNPPQTTKEFTTMVRSQTSIREVVGVAVGNASYKISDRTPEP